VRGFGPKSKLYANGELATSIGDAMHRMTRRFTSLLKTSAQIMYVLVDNLVFN
jgi:hypothetical protein